MLIGSYYGGVELHREEKVVLARFLAPHRVISTCSLAGGVREDLTAIYNHQLCEPNGHIHGSHDLAISDPWAYHRLVCETHGLEAERCATLGTAASMNCLGIATGRFRHLEVVATCTAGVEANAGRAGDPAQLYEWDGRFELLTDRAGEKLHGTINTMVFISQELSPGALVQTLTVATEGKIAALHELAIGSRYSEGPATGTGTDQIAIACRRSGNKPLIWTGKHSKLGELAGGAVHDAIKQALALQNHMTPAGRCSALAHLERFGAVREPMIEGVAGRLGPELGILFRANFTSIEIDPLIVAAVAALCHLRDKLAWGILPDSCAPEILCSYGAQLSAAVSGRFEQLPHYRAQLASTPRSTGTSSLLDLVFAAIALGYSDRWATPVP